MKSTLKRFLSLVLCMCMVMALLPNVTITAFAAESGEVTGLSNENIGLSYSGDKTDTWSANGTTVTGSIQSSSGCGTTHYSSTLTITNKRSITAVLSFNYAIDAQGGTIQVDGTAVTAGGTFSKELAAGGTVSVYIKSNSTSAPTKITLSNVKISGRLVVWGGGTAAVYCSNGTTAAEVIACRVDGPVKVIFDRESTLLVYDKIKTRITERAGKFPETEIVFYAMDDLLNAQRDLNKMVDENLIQAEIPAHLYALVGEQTVSAVLKNNSKTDSYTIEIRRDLDGSLIADPITLAAGASVSSITLKDVPEYGNAACTATITATRDGKTVGTLEVKTALHAAYLWPKEVMSK